MKQQDIAKHIGELLYYHDCVILPNLGGFIANYSSAKIDPHRKLIHPPSKRILFNKHVKVNDGLLASKIVKEESISFEKANKALASFVNSTKRKINSGERVAFQKIGVLYLNKENNIQFIQDATNFLTSSYGLPAVDLIPIESAIVSEVKKEVEIIPLKPTASENVQHDAVIAEKKTAKNNAEVSTPAEEKNENKNTRAALWAAAILLPIFLLYSVFVGYNGFQSEDGFNTASFNPLNWFSQQDSVFDTVLVEPSNFSEPNPNNADINTVEILPTLRTEDDTVIGASFVTDGAVDSSENRENIEAIAESTYVDPEENLTPKLFRYYLIGGCFSKDKYAFDFVTEMNEEGFSAEELDVHNGLHRISLGGTNSRKEARVLRKKAKEKGISCWILRR